MVTRRTLPATLSSEDTGQGSPQPAPPAPPALPALPRCPPSQGPGSSPLSLCRMAEQTAPGASQKPNCQQQGGG